MLKLALQAIATATTGYKGLEGELRPGDVVVASPRPAGAKESPFAKAVSAALTVASQGLQGDKTHSMLYLGDGKLLDIRAGSQTAQLPVREALRGLDAEVVRPRLPEATRAEAARRAVVLAEKAPNYDYSGVLKAVLVEAGVPLKGTRSDDALTCSSVIAHAYRAKLTPKPRALTLPVDFLQNDKLAPVVTFLNRGRKDRP